MPRLLPALLLAASTALVAPFAPAEPLAIQDNSFLIEEAYNQETMVVQHIFNWSRDRHGDYVGTFTQEWPAGGLKHQLSYTLPVQRSVGARGIGDTLLNYRYQLIGDGSSRLAVAPRASLILPTGNERRGLGGGGYGFDLNLPVSVAVSGRIVTHWNAGVAKVPSSAERTAWSAGGSVIAAASRNFHLMLETRWTDAAGGPSLTVSPGVRWAWNFENGLQVVPGVAVPLGNDHSRALFLYLSLEHPFGR